MTSRAASLLLLLAIMLVTPPAALRAQQSGAFTHIAAPGDTWTALSMRSASPVSALLRQNRTINPHRAPAVNSAVNLPALKITTGTLLRPMAGGLLQTAVTHGHSPWSITLHSNGDHPFRPWLYAPLFLPNGTEAPRDLPIGFATLTIYPGTLRPGQALALNASASSLELPFISLEKTPWPTARRGETLSALGGTGAFYPPGQPTLRIDQPGKPLWEQPLMLEPGDWTFEQLTFTGTAVFDQEAIVQERERLQVIWDQFTPRPLWQGAFIHPIRDYLTISSLYGARRSVNGGPYSSYHEGTDYSAYGGTAVYAPASGRVALAEQLQVRGGAVILDHGLGLHSGYYHLSAIHVRHGQRVQAGELLGEVGTTGRSTGNHLHWDLLVGRTWVDPLAWLESDAAHQIAIAWPAAPDQPASRHIDRP